MLVNAGVMETPDDPVILFDLHKRFKIDVGNAGGLSLQGEEQGQILLPVAAAADFPEAFADRLDLIAQTVIVAEGAGGIAAVGFAHGGEACAQQAAAAAPGKTFLRTDKKRAGGTVRRPGNRFFRAGNDGLQAGDVLEHLQPPRFHGGFNLRENRQGDFLLAAAGRFILRQGGEEPEPGQGVFFGDFHSGCHPFSDDCNCYGMIALSLTIWAKTGIINR